MMEDTIAVVGAGNGGMAMAAYLASCGAKVNLCDLFPEYIKDIQKTGYIELTHAGKISRQHMNMVTVDIAEAISHVKLILVVTPAFTHRIIAENCSETLNDGQIIVLNPGRTGGALEFFNTVRSKGCHKDITISEAQTLIYSCRKTGDCSVEIYGTQKK